VKTTEFGLLSYAAILLGSRIMHGKTSVRSSVRPSVCPMLACSSNTESGRTLVHIIPTTTETCYAILGQKVIKYFNLGVMLLST